MSGNVRQSLCKTKSTTNCKTTTIRSLWALHITIYCHPYIWVIHNYGKFEISLAIPKYCIL